MQVILIVLELSLFQPPLSDSLVDWIIHSAKMRRRFNKSAAAVRARMAQKCKDERRFGRVLPPGCLNQPSAV
ncbi:unnamed protein product, partial [Dibothriocephalus latus]